MRDALSAVGQFTSEGNLSRNGDLGAAAMREVWDCESQEPFSGKIGDISEKNPEKFESSQVGPSGECELCGGDHRVEQCPHEGEFGLEVDTPGSDSGERLPDGGSEGVDCSRPQWRRPVVWRPAQSVGGITDLMRYHHTGGTLALEDLLELDPRGDQLGAGHG